MRPLHLSVLALLVVFFAAPFARAQCSDWRAGPLFEGGPDNNGANGPVVAMTSWDPDGPAPPVLVVGVNSPPSPGSR